MDPEHRRKLRDPDLISAMVACIDFDALAPSLHSRGVLTAAMVDDIKEKTDLNERNLCLLYRLPKRGPLAFDRFVSILRENRMFQAVHLLTGEPQPEPPASSVVQPPPHHGARPFGGGDARLDSAHNGHGTVAEATDSELHVVPAKELRHGDDVYTMIHSPRGMCIIINNIDFGRYAERRDGSEHDVRRMKALFEKFHFNCIVRSDLSASQIKTLLSWAAQPKQQEGADCLVVILMSHGKKDMIDGIDGEQVHLVDDVFTLFNNEKCPALQGKPKLFFIQACRGTKDDSGTGTVVFDTADAGPIPAEVPQSSSARQERLATWSDMYIAYATIPGYKALKNSTIGSWFLADVFSVFSENAGIMHLETMMRHVQNKVLARSAHDGSKQTCSVELQGWTKKLYFNPGFFVDHRPEQAEVLHTAL
ncbi:caspase-7-like [Rhipicephalus sanguineus]|uniref:caspase-7-like n=1 Tax=Rhipicephalus sanguineus TaxID=34632 RepID=UPI0018956AA4|nr:caspase-7-like [Rhipicephalus sanguineus]